MAVESWVAERAKEELEMLESRHPDRFDYLKMELRSLVISNSDDLALSDPNPTLAATQVSSNDRKRKRRRPEDGGGSMDRVEMAIERAEACLRRIRRVKQSLFC